MSGNSNRAVGLRQAEILELLARDGAWSLGALVMRLAPDQPRQVTDAVERLRQRRIVEVHGRRGRSMTGAVVSLVPPESRPATASTRGPAHDDIHWMAPWLTTGGG